MRTDPELKAAFARLRGLNPLWINLACLHCKAWQHEACVDEAGCCGSCGEGWE